MDQEKSTKINFVKMHGAGNDFVLIDNETRSYDLEWSKLASRICRRRHGIGADGLLVLEQSEGVDFAMRYFNADGSSGGMCGNGGRCIALYFMRKHSLANVKFEALGSVYSASMLDRGVKLRMLSPTDFHSFNKFDISAGAFPLHFVNTGSPHAVVFHTDLPESLRGEATRSASIDKLGAAIAHDPRFGPAGTNVDFIEILDNNVISMRTYERGVEEETLACGTGAVASAVVASNIKKLPSPVLVRTRSNEILTVSFEGSGNSIAAVDLSGSASVVFFGQFTFEENHIQSP